MVAVAVGDWAPQTRYGLPTQAALTPGLFTFTLNVLLLAPEDDLGLAPEVAVLETQNDLLVKRVVGGIIFRAGVVFNSTLRIHERIRVGLLNADGDASFFATELNDADDANEPFLWERVSTLEVVAETTYTWPQADAGHPGWSQIDCRVARRLNRAEALFYSVEVARYEAGPFNVADLFLVTGYLRTWGRALS